MREQELWKKVPIYFYYLSISKHKDAKDDSAYSTDQIIIAFFPIAGIYNDKRTS